jgi:hypothetical protein
MRFRTRPAGFQTLLFLAAANALALPSCEWDGHFTVLGYSTRPNYDTNIHTVYVPIFQNKTMYRGLEFQFTQAVVREIQAKTPFRVESDCSRADTELIGTIVSVNKNIVNRNQLNEVREAEFTVTAEIVWRDRRTGEILSQPRAPGAPPVIMPGVPTPNGALEPLPIAPPPAKPAPVVITSTGGFIPELGASTATGLKDSADRMAIQIVSMMEKGW